MASAKKSAPAKSPAQAKAVATTKATRPAICVLIVLIGIVAGQALLYGPSLAGQKVLLPLDILKLTLLPDSVSATNVDDAVHDVQLSDLIYAEEPARRFAAAEFKAVRLPMWDPGIFAGTPFIWPKFSPFMLLAASTESPRILAWVQLLAALVAGGGAWRFCRRALGLGFWPATVAGWCYPLTGFFVLWTGYRVPLAVCWLPWLLLAVDRTVRRGSWAAPVGLALATALALVSGQLDTAGQVLLASGLYALWCLWDAYGRECFGLRARRALVTLVAGWLLGILLAAPYALPVIEYTRGGARMARRQAGKEERPPLGPSTLPQTVLPGMNGAMTGDTVTWGGSVPCESTSGGYAGLVATLVFAPLAWCSRRQRGATIFFAGLAVVGLSWCINVPGIVQLLRLPGLNMMSHNRLVFVTGFSLLALAAIGLEAVMNGQASWRKWFWLGPAVLVMLGAWCWWRSTHLPEPIATQFEAMVRKGTGFGWVHTVNGVHAVQEWTKGYFRKSAGWCAVGVVVWLLLRLQPRWQKRVPALAVILLAGELIWYGRAQIVQCEPELYFPPIATLNQVAKANPPRIVAADCLPANLHELYGLRDIRGYDAVDPKDYMDLMAIVRGSESLDFDYAYTQWMTPKAEVTPDGVFHFAPVLNLLAVDYAITRNPPPPFVKTAFSGPGYWAIPNPAAMPRAWVPKRVEMLPEAKARLEKMAAKTFDPAEVAYVETPVNVAAAVQGTVELLKPETPVNVQLEAKMTTPGLVVLADRWDKGWSAFVNGRPTAILRVNHALRGVAVPVGTSRIEFRYEPASFSTGLELAAVAGAVLLAWGGLGRRRVGMTKHQPSPRLRLAGE